LHENILQHVGIFHFEVFLLHVCVQPCQGLFPPPFFGIIIWSGYW
jgi:hypothetical protein